MATKEIKREKQEEKAFAIEAAVPVTCLKGDATKQIFVVTSDEGRSTFVTNAQE